MRTDKEGTITHTHFVAIPFNAADKAGAMVVANFLLAPEAQLKKADPAVWGDLPVIDVSRLAYVWHEKFASLSRSIATLPETALRKAACRSPRCRFRSAWKHNGRSRSTGNDSTFGKIMNTRRQFIRKLFKAVVAGGLLGPFRMPSSPAIAGMQPTAELPRHTDPQSLINRNPRLLDTRHLKVMVLKDFKTMGLSDHRVDLANWRLNVNGKVRTPLRLTYAELKALPHITANVLLICPGVFCNHGRWQGVSIRSLLAAAGADSGITHVTVRGPAGPYQKTHRLETAQVANDSAFLAYAVNDRPLPVAHGFPLRLVSGGDYGFDWIKYVDQIEAERIEGISKGSASDLTTF